MGIVAGMERYVPSDDRRDGRDSDWTRTPPGLSAEEAAVHVDEG
jgi:hypothetical protein